MKYSDQQRIELIKSTVDKLLKYLEEEQITRQDVLEKEPIRWTITTPLYNIGEHAYQISKDFKNEHADIPWAKISGLRHRLVHDYEDTNWETICTIIFETLPDFKAELSGLSFETKE